MCNPGASTVSGVITSSSSGISNAASVAFFYSFGCGSGGFLVSTITTTCGFSCPSVSTPGISTFISRSISGILTYSFSDSATTTGIYTTPMIWPCIYVKFKCLCWWTSNTLTRGITVSGIGIRSQLRRTIFFAVFKDINLCLPCIFPLVSSKISPLVLLT